MKPTETQLRAQLKRAHELLAKCGGSCLGIAMSGSNHPNPDEVLTNLFHECNDECQAIGKLLS